MPPPFPLDKAYLNYYIEMKSYRFWYWIALIQFVLGEINLYENVENLHDIEEVNEEANKNE